jgi:hypothetical protein
MTEFPAFVYKGKGKHQGNGGTFDAETVQTAEELSKKLSEGWFLNHGEAILASKSKSFAATPISKPVEPVSELSVDDNAPPTRQELETKAAELGIKFDGRYSDKRLALLIDEALEK